MWIDWIMKIMEIKAHDIINSSLFSSWALRSFSKWYRGSFFRQCPWWVCLGPWTWFRLTEWWRPFRHWQRLWQKFPRTWCPKTRLRFFLLQSWPVCWTRDRTCYQQGAWRRFHYHTYQLRQASFQYPWKIVCRWYHRPKWFHGLPCSRRQWLFWIFIVRQCPRFGVWWCFLQFRRFWSWNRHRWWARNWIWSKKYLSLKILSENLRSKLDLPTEEFPMSKSLNK